MKIYSNDLRRSFWRFVLPIVLLATSCASNPMKIENISVPVGATRGVSDTRYRTAAIADMNTKLIDIKERFGNYDSEIYVLSQPTNWQEIGRFYDTELAASGYTRKTNVPSAPIDADIIYYEKAGGRDKLAVSLIEAVGSANDERRQFLLLAVSK